MKKINLLIITLSVFIVVSCGEKEEKDNASIEPNDTIAEANTVSPGTEIKMKINPENDIDWYEVEAPGQGYLEVFTRDVPDDIRPRVRFATYDEWGEKKANYLTSYSKTPEAIPVDEEGKFHLKVLESDQRFGEGKYSDEEFYIKIDFTEEFDAFEPNDKPASATKIKLGEEQQSAIFPTGDKDWFSFEVEEQGYLNIGAKDVPDNIDLAAKIATYDEYRSDKVESVKSTTSLPFNVAITEPGEYHVALRDKRHDHQSKDLFTWRLKFTPEMDDYEPNDSVRDAAEIELGASAEIAVFPEGDRDFFKVSPEGKGTLTVKARSPEDIDLAAKLVKLDPENSDKTVTLEDWTNLPLSFDVEDPEQNYFITLKDRRDSYASRDTFKVVFEFE